MGVKTLELTLISAKDLKNVNLIGKMDVYVVVYLSDDPKHKQKSPVHQDSGPNPTWNYTMRFTIDEAAASRPGKYLVFKLLHEHTFGADKELGEVLVSIKELLDGVMSKDPSAPQVLTYQVKRSGGKAKGELKFSCKFIDVGQQQQHNHGFVAHASCSGSSSSYHSAPPPPQAVYPPPSGVAAAQGYPSGGGYPPQKAGGYPPQHTEPPVAVPYAGPPPPQGYPPYGGYPPPPPGGAAGYGYPPQPPLPSGYPGGYPPAGYAGGYPPAGYVGQPQRPQKPKKNNFGMGLGAGLLGGALGGLLLGEVVDDVYDSGYDAGYDNGGGFDDGGDFGGGDFGGGDW